MQIVLLQDKLGSCLKLHKYSASLVCPYHVQIVGWHEFLSEIVGWISLIFNDFQRWVDPGS